MRRRTHGHDYLYGIEHAERFPEQYKRIEHRFKMADVDWTEFCGYGRCHRPLMLVEMYRDTPGGQDLSDKGVTVTRHLATGVHVPAYVMAYLTDRPPEVEAEIKRLNDRVLQLHRQHTITRVRAQQIAPPAGDRSRTPEEYSLSEWWELVALRHSEHHQECAVARRSGERHASSAWLMRATQRHGGAGLWTPGQPVLAGMDAA